MQSLFTDPSKTPLKIHLQKYLMLGSGGSGSMWDSAQLLLVLLEAGHEIWAPEHELVHNSLACFPKRCLLCLVSAACSWLHWTAASFPWALPFFWHRISSGLFLMANSLVGRYRRRCCFPGDAEFHCGGGVSACPSDRWNRLRFPPLSDLSKALPKQVNKL